MRRAHPRRIDDLAVLAADRDATYIGSRFRLPRTEPAASVIDLKPITSRGTYRLGSSNPKFRHRRRARCHELYGGTDEEDDLYGFVAYCEHPADGSGRIAIE
jgi:hypothetical protein